MKKDTGEAMLQANHSWLVDGNSSATILVVPHFGPFFGIPWVATADSGSVRLPV